MFRMHFTPAKWKMIVQDWIGVTLNILIRSQFIERVNRFTYLGSGITTDGSKDEELLLCIQNMQLINVI